MPNNLWHTILSFAFQPSDVSQRYNIPAKPKSTYVYHGTIGSVNDMIVKMSNKGYQVQHLQVTAGYGMNMVVMVKY